MKSTKKVHLGSLQTQSRIATAVADLARIVGATLGPGGKPILIEEEGRLPIATKDGVTVARAYGCSGDVESVVTSAAIEACERTVREAGDGTTTAIVLASAILEIGQKWLKDHPSVSPQAFSRDLLSTYRDVIKPEVESLVWKISELPAEEAKKAVYHVALVSANFDEEIAKAVADAIDAIGDDGIVTVEEGVGKETRIELERGFSFSSGLEDLGASAAAAFMNRAASGDSVLDLPYVCVYDGEISETEALLPLFDRVSSQIDERGKRIQRPVVVFAHRFSDSVLKWMATNFRRGVLSCLPVVSPRRGLEGIARSQFLHDVAAFAGTTVFDPQGFPLESAQLPQLGLIEKIKISRLEGVLFGEPDDATIDERVSALKAQMESSDEHTKGVLRYRVGRLAGGVATVYAGGRTAFEAKERRDRAHDAVSAARAALKEGVVPGGGCSLAWVTHALGATSSASAQVLSAAIERPFRLILENAGIDSSSFSEEIGWSHQGVGLDRAPFFVVDASSGRLVDWRSAGILDPVRATLSALENALSVAQLLMTCGGVITLSRDADTQKMIDAQLATFKALEDRG